MRTDPMALFSQGSSIFKVESGKTLVQYCLRVMSLWTFKIYRKMVLSANHRFVGRVTLVQTPSVGVTLFGTNHSTPNTHGRIKDHSAARIIDAHQSLSVLPVFKAFTAVCLTIFLLEV